MNKVLCPEQFGFRDKKSTTHAGFEFIKYITESINGGTPVATLFLDMTKAFDFVNHSKLLIKLERYGIRGRAHDWIRSYLTNRVQCTEINRLTLANNTAVKQVFRSQPKVNHTGVPQGSILGPLLFIIYINDLPNATRHKVVMFADDTTIMVKCDNSLTFNQDINNSLYDIINWMDINDLKINISKTKFMQIQSYNSNRLPMTVEYENEKVEEASSIKFLGFTLDKHLHWKDHIEQVCNRLNRFVFALRRLRDTVSVEAALTAYHGYVSSVLRYGLILWGNSVDVERVLIIQKKCIRVICNAWSDDSCVPLFKKLHILPLPCLYIKEICIFVDTHRHLFKKRAEVLDRQTRQTIMNLLFKPRVRKMIYGKNVFNMCIVIYNKLPKDIKLLKGNSFKSKLTAWLLDKCFYSVKKYLDYDIYT